MSRNRGYGVPVAQASGNGAAQMASLGHVVTGAAGLIAGVAVSGGMGTVLAACSSGLLVVLVVLLALLGVLGRTDGRRRDAKDVLWILLGRGRTSGPD